MEKKGVLAVLIIFIGVAFVSYWFFLPKMENNVAYPYPITSFEKEKQEIGKLHFDHLPITYSLATNTNQNARICPDFQVQRVRQAFGIIENSTNSTVRFMEVDLDNGDILVYCSNAEGEGAYSTSGTGGYESRGKVITRGILTMYTHRNCGTWPDVEIHEILHIFGYGHIEDEWSIMNPIQKRCDLGKIDSLIVDDLKEIYSGV